MTISRRPPIGSFIAGGATLLVGVMAFVESIRYPFGSIGQIGPAIFPLGLSLLLVGAGIAILAEDISARAVPERPVALRTILAVVGGPIALALLILPFGLIPAITASVLISALADRSLKLSTALMVAAALSISCTLVFITILKLPIIPINWPF